MNHIVVADDDKAVRQMLADYLADQNITARSVSNRVELNRQLNDVQLSMILLDLELGQEDGLDLLREIRSRSDVPIIAMTGHRSEEIDRVVGLELGADDYIIKPFGLRELVARVRAVLRRQEVGRATRARRFGVRRLQIRGVAARSSS